MSHTRTPVSRVLLTLSLMLLTAGSVSTTAFAVDDAPRKPLKARQIDSSGEVDEALERAAEAKRLESIDRLRDLLSNTNAEGDQKAEMMLRLAELYFAQGRSLYYREMNAFDKKFDQCFNTEGCPTDKMQPDNAGSRGWQDKSIKLYENILRSYPRYRKADAATFYLASALQDTGRTKEASEAFKTLVKRYPDSAFVPDSYVAIGEYYFDDNQAWPALKAYLKATQYTESDKYPFAMYKLAWCYYNVGDYNESITTMKTVVSFAMSQAAAGSKGNLQLQDEALKDLVRFFADAGMMNEAYAYFEGLGKKDLIRSMLQRLAAMYSEQGKWEQAIDTYRRLILEAPQDIKNPTYQGEIVGAYRKMDNKDKTLEEVDRLLREYGKDSAWARANAANPAAVKDAMDSIELNLRRVATEYHEQARKLEKVRHPSADGVYELARRAYDQYLREFAATEKAYDVRYAYGELLYNRKDFAGAFDQYVAVVKQDPNGKHSRFCAESAVFAAEQQVKIESGDISTRKIDASQAKQAQDLTDWERRLVDSCNLYAKLFPKDAKTIGVIYKSAYLLYQKYRFEEAADQFNAVIAMDPASSQAEQAANLILDSFAVREDYGNLKRNAKVYYDQKGLGSSKFKQEVYTIYQNASFKLIEQTFATDKNAGAAADALVAWYDEFGPKSENAALALNNASIYYYQSNRVADSMRVRHILVEDANFGPKTKYYYDQIAALGYDYETIAAFDKAAFYYEKLWSLYPEERKKVAKADDSKVAELDTKAADAIFSAAVFRSALGDWQRGIDNYTQLLTAFPTDERGPDIRLTIGRVYEDQQNWAKAAETFLAFYTKPPEGVGPEFIYFARLHHAQALEKQGKPKDVSRVYEESVKAYERFISGGGAPGAHTEFVAEMMFKLAAPKLDEYLALQIKGCGCTNRQREDKALGDGLKKKAQALVAVEGNYKKILETGAGEWGLAGLVALGRAYENMSETLNKSDPPFYLTADQLEIYRMTLEDRAYVQREKSIEAYKLALEKSYELTLYNDNTAIATRRLGELRPQEFQGLRELLVTPRYMAAEAGRTFDYEPGL